MPHIGLPSHWKTGVSLALLTTWRVGGPAAYFTRPTSLAGLRADLRAARERELPCLLIGQGSNLLFSDRGYRGLIVRLPRRAFPDLPPPAPPLPPPAERQDVALWGGAPLSGEVRRLAAAGLEGLEWAEGIPGTVAGAIVGNAGAYGATIADPLAGVTLLASGGPPRWEPAAALALRYRGSALKGHDPTRAVVLFGHFRLGTADPRALAARRRHIAAQRRARLPAEPSCGCVFRNPPGLAAGALIDRLGMRGLACGDAMVSREHANFIVNRGAATAAQVLSLIERIRTRALREAGIALELEVQIVGEGPDAPQTGEAPSAG